MSVLIAVDPGPVQSAWLALDVQSLTPLAWAKEDNAFVLGVLTESDANEFAIEVLASYGMPVGAEVFETAYAIGGFERRWIDVGRPEPVRVYRKDVKLHICGNPRAKDANIRQALIDRYGGKEKAIGRKKTPGPLYGMAGDCWSALAVAITASECRERG